jgi:hypothetical protein
VGGDGSHGRAGAKDGVDEVGTRLESPGGVDGAAAVGWTTRICRPGERRATLGTGTCARPPVRG